MLTVACVLRSGGRYTPEWVRKLQRGVSQHLTLPHRFVCFSDVEVPCERIPLVTDWPGWWSKIEIFRPGLFDGPVLYFDLDMLIVGSLDEIAAHPHTFTMGHEYYRPKFKCSTAMAWGGDFSAIYEAMHEAPEAIAAKYDVERPDRRIGDQAFIEDVNGGDKIDTFCDLFGETSIASYKVHAKKGIPSGAAAIAFHGLPKMDTAGGYAQRIWEAL